MQKNAVKKEQNAQFTPSTSLYLTSTLLDGI